MTSFEKYIYEHLHLLRRTIQILTVVFIFFVPFLNISGFKEIIGTFYSISFGNLDIVDPALMLQNLLLTKEIYFPLLLAGVIPLILALFFGKVFCGWVCPYNFLAEFAVKLGKKFKSKKKNGLSPGLGFAMMNSITLKDESHYLVKTFLASVFGQ